jgi:hypothetical protein
MDGSVCTDYLQNLGIYSDETEEDVVGGGAFSFDSGFIKFSSSDLDLQGEYYMPSLSIQFTVVEPLEDEDDDEYIAE